jgi:hypothetical protein
VLCPAPKMVKTGQSEMCRWRLCDGVEHIFWRRLLALRVFSPVSPRGLKRLGWIRKLSRQKAKWRDHSEVRGTLGFIWRYNVRQNELFERLSTRLIIAAFVLLVAVGFPSVSIAQVRVILSGGFAAAYNEVLPEFEKPQVLRSQLPTEPRKATVLTRSGLSFGVACLRTL